MRYFYTAGILLLFILTVIIKQMQAQQYDCSFKPPVVKIDFGSGNMPDINSARLPKYRRDFSTCPKDGFYSYTSNTSNCFRGDWFTINEDHTGNLQNGNMMLVNASETGGIFFYTTIDGLTPNTNYQFGIWLMNVCRINGGCSPLPPDISIMLLTPDNRKIATFSTGTLIQRASPFWKKYIAFFQTPPNVTSFKLIMEDKTLGGCGNDFALDDITISECMIPKPTVQDEPPPVVKQPVKQQPVVVKQETAVKPQVVKQPPVKTNQVKDSNLLTTKPVADIKPVIIAPVIKERPVIKLPEPITTRANPIVKQIETAASEILIELYDNGEIDHDTVTIYHNNSLVVSRAGLSEKPVSFSIKIDKAQPHHELIMVADNLGSIPPNTSMMIVTANNKRYEVFISSSEQKNAKVVIDLKE